MQVPGAQDLPPLTEEDFSFLLEQIGQTNDRENDVQNSNNSPQDIYKPDFELHDKYESRYIIKTGSDFHEERTDDQRAVDKSGFEFQACTDPIIAGGGINLDE